MSGWRSVARKDVSDAIRSRRLWLLVVVFVLFIVLIEYAVASFTEIPSIAVLLGSLLVPTLLFVPLLGLVTSYRSIAAERESGSHRLLLSLPHSRRDVVLGKLVGRGVVVSSAVTAGFVAGGIAALALVGVFDVALLVGYYLVTLLYALAFVGLGIGVSAATGSTSVAVGGGFGAFVLFQFLWGFVVNLLRTRLFGGRGDAVFGAIANLSPLAAYPTGVDVGLGGPLAAANTPYYGQGWYALVVLVFWVVVPPTLGYLRFRSADV